MKKVRTTSQRSTENSAYAKQFQCEIQKRSLNSLASSCIGGLMQPSYLLARETVWWARFDSSCLNINASGQTRSDFWNDPHLGYFTSHCGLFTAHAHTHKGLQVNLSQKIRTRCASYDLQLLMSFSAHWPRLELVLRKTAQTPVVWLLAPLHQLFWSANLLLFGYNLLRAPKTLLHSSYRHHPVKKKYS